MSKIPDSERQEHFAPIISRYLSGHIIERDPISILVRSRSTQIAHPFDEAQIESLLSLLPAGQGRAISRAFVSDALTECSIMYRLESEVQSNARSLRAMKKKAARLEGAIDRFLTEWKGTGVPQLVGEATLAVYWGARRTVPSKFSPGSKYDLTSVMCLERAAVSLRIARRVLRQLKAASPGAPPKAALDHLLRMLGQLYSDLTGKRVTANDRRGGFVDFAEAVLRFIDSSQAREIIVSRTRRIFRAK